MDILDSQRDEVPKSISGTVRSDVPVLDDLLREQEIDEDYNHREEDEEFNAKYRGLTVVFKVSPPLRRSILGCENSP